MTRIEQLEQQIKALNRSELAALRDWFQAYLADEWDRQIEADAQAGKLDRVADRAISQHRKGNSKPL